MIANKKNVIAPTFKDDVYENITEVAKEHGVHKSTIVRRIVDTFSLTKLHEIGRAAAEDQKERTLTSKSISKAKSLLKKHGYEVRDLRNKISE